MAAAAEGRGSTSTTAHAWEEGKDAQVDLTVGLGPGSDGEPPRQGPAVQDGGKWDHRRRDGCAANQDKSKASKARGSDR